MFEDFYMPQFDADYFNSPAFQQAIAAAVQQYSPQPVEPVYYAPEPVYYAPEPVYYAPEPVYYAPEPVYYAPEPVYYAPARGIGRRGEYVDDIYDVQPAEEVYVNQGPSAEEIAAAQAEAQRVAAEQEYFARVEAERVAAERAAAAEAAAQRQQTELNERRAQAAQAAAERAAQERAFAEQVAAQAAAEAQAAAQAQAQAAAQAEAQRVAAEQAQAEQAAAVAPAPEPVAGIGRRGGEDYYQPEFKIPEVYAPQPEPIYYAPEPEIYRGIGDGLERNFYDADRRYPAEDIYTPAVEPVTIEAEPVRAPAVEPMTIEAEPVAGIGSPAVAAPAEAPSVIETAVAAPAASPTAAPAAGTQVINNNDYSPSDTDLQTMQMSRDQWNEMMASLATLDLGNLNFGNFGVTNPDYTNNFRTFTAPKSNKGNPTSTVAKKDNTFNVIENQPIRLVDMSTGKVVFQGTGYEAAEKAIELAAGLTKAGGNKADWEIQTGQFKNPGSGDLQFGDSFKTVANEKKNTSILNQALDIVGDAALGFIIGGPVGAAIAAGASAAGVNVSDIAYPIIATAVLGPVGPAATAGAAALGSAVSSAVQGRSIEETLIRAAAAGATAGVMSGTDIGGDISEAVGGVLKDIGVESQVGDIISGIGGSGTVDAVTGDIVINAATDAAVSAISAGATGAAVSSAVVDAVQQVVPDYQPSPETNAALNKLDEAAANSAAVAADPTIVVSANPVTTAVSGANPIVETAAGVAGGFAGIGDLVNSPELQDARAEERQPEVKEDIVVTATPEPEVIPVPETAGIGNIIPVEVPPSTVSTEPPKEEIVVTAPESDVAPIPETAAGIGGIPPINTAVTTTPAQPVEEQPVVEEPKEEILVTAPETTTPLPDVAAGIGGGIPGIEDLIKSPEFQEDLADEQAGKDKDNSLLEKIGDVADIVQVAAPIIGGVVGGGGDGGGTIAPDTSKINFTKTTLRPTIPVGGIGGTGGYPYTPQTYGRRGGDQETEYLFFTRDPVTGEPAVAPAVPAAAPGKKEGGEIDDDMVKHLVEYHKNGGHQGPGQVKGIGSGQEDKIPAWLSDGEYVWSAQDVSDLGDGSNKEGVRRLDKMRQMVRRQAGRKDVKKIAKPQKGIDTMLKAVGGMV